MTEIRTKDRLFLAAVVPLALACAYFFYLRPSAAAKLKMLEDLDRTTVTHEEYPGEKRLRSAALTQAQANLVAEQNIKPPASEVAGHADDTPARRTCCVVAVFRSAGMRVVSASLAQDGAGDRAANALRATGVRPVPVKRVYVLEGAFPALKKAFETFAREKSPVVVSSLESAGGDKWKVEIHE